MNARAYFVYGTLRPGGRFWPNVASYVADYEPAYLDGYTLHHLPEGYPAIRAASGRVFGDLLFVRSRCEDLVADIIDEIEGCDQPGSPNLYDRATVDVNRLRALGEMVLADTYVYALDRLEHLETRGDWIPSGDWREYVALTEGLEP